MMALRWLRRLLLLAGAALVLATCTPLGLWYAQALAGPWPAQPQRGTLVVLGGDMEDPNTMGLATYRRAYYARLYWRSGTFKHVVLLGRDAAPAMREWLLFHGVPDPAIVWESQSESTAANAEALHSLLAVWKTRTGQAQPEAPLVLLTSDYHCWRARRALARAGIDAVVQPVPDAGKRWQHWANRWSVCVDLAVETAKILNSML